MSWLIALAGQWRLIGVGLLAVGLLWGGWVVKGKFDRAAEADGLEKLLDETNAAYKAQVEATFKAEQARIKLSGELAAARAKREIVTKEVIRVIRKSVPDNRSCDIPINVLHQLNTARGYHVSEPSKRTPSP